MCSLLHSKEDSQKSFGAIHPDLLVAIKLAYEPSGLLCRNIVKEAESEEYGAFVFEMNDKHVKFRVGKITPKKVGQFVTLWKRVADGPIVPHDVSDPVDFFVVSVRSGERLGQFIFPKEVLLQRDIISKDGQGGKLGIRIYPPWDIANNPQAKKTQAWQQLYFFEISPGGYGDVTQFL